MENTIFLVSKQLKTLSYNITIDANGGICDIFSKSVVVGEKIGELPIPTYDNKFFRGWYTERDGGILVTPDTIAGIYISTIYALWIDPVEIEWDATTNGGTLVPLTETHYYYPTQPFGKLPSATGTTELPYLDSWWTTPDDSGEEISTLSIVGDVRKFYAHYIDYSDPIGRVICPTKNLWFTTESDKYFWILSDETITDGSGYISPDFTQNWFYFNEQYWWMNNYMTCFETVVDSPGVLRFDLNYQVDYSGMRGIAVVGGKYSSEQILLWANYVSFMYDIGGAISGNLTSEEMLNSLNGYWGGMGWGTVYPVSYVSNGGVFSGEIVFADAPHDITFLCGYSERPTNPIAHISNIRWYPS